MKVKFNVKRYFQVLGITLSIIIATTAIAMGIDFSALLGNNDVDNTSTVQASDGKINVLLMAVDIDGLRTDAMMLASFDTETKQLNMLTIPRDTRVFVGNRFQKINAAHAYVGDDGKIGGATAACEVVTRVTGIPINYYVDFSFDGVAHVINELGPVEFTIPDLYGDGVGMVYDDPVQSLHINLPPGTYELDGSQAVQLMRYRHGNPGPNGVFKGYPNGDEGRTQMQQEFIKAVIDQKLNAGVIMKIPSIFKAISEEIKTNFTIGDVIKYSKYLSGFSSENIMNYELPGEFATVKIDGMNADVWEVNIEETRTLVQTVFGYPADNITIDNPNTVVENSNSTSTSGTSNSYSTGYSNSSNSTGDISTNSSYSSEKTTTTSDYESYETTESYDDYDAYTDDSDSYSEDEPNWVATSDYDEDYSYDE